MFQRRESSCRHNSPVRLHSEPLGMDSMTLTVASIFLAGLLVGYALRAWPSQRRLEKSLRGRSRGSAPQTTTFGHARRAF